MTDIDTIEQRLSAIERALADDDGDCETLAVTADVADRLTAVEDRLDDLESDLAELDATTQALRGYVGNVRSVTDEVERRAETALAKVEQLEAERDATATGEDAFDECAPAATGSAPVDGGDRHDSRDAHRQTDHDEPDHARQNREQRRQQHSQDSQHSQDRQNPRPGQERQHGQDRQHTCDACGQVRPGERADAGSGAEPTPGGDKPSRRTAESRPTETTAWARDVGTDREPTATGSARTDGGRGERDTRGQRRRGQHQRGRDAEDGDDGVLAALRDAL